MNIPNEIYKIIVKSRTVRDVSEHAKDIEQLVTRAVDDALDRAANIASSFDLTMTPIGWEGSAISK